MDEMLITYNHTLYLLNPIMTSQHWNYGTLQLNEDSYSGVWWQMDATDDNGNEYALCWFEENTIEDDDGTVDVNFYRPDIIQCTYCVDE